LRKAIEPFKDYHAAQASGYVQFLAQIPQPMYHFTNWQNAFKNLSSFDPARPTSLLQPGHLHVNLCFPPAGRGREMFGPHPQFGLAGSIVTQEQCAAAGGTFRPVIHNWMVHVWPFETNPSKVWASQEHPGAIDR
jgi:hypothetical protein